MASTWDEQKRGPLLALLQDRAARIADLESRAAQTIEHDKDQAGYESLMLAKAESLASLAGDAEPLLDGADKDEAAALRGFSKSAAMSLKVGSVFFMSALLYPDDHRPGTPNNLELLIESMKSRM